MKTKMAVLLACIICANAAMAQFKLGVKAGELVVANKYGYMVALHATEIVAVELEKALSKQKRVDADYYDTATLFSK